MQFGLIGLGRMGRNLALHALETKHQVVGHDADPRALSELQADGFTPASSLEDLVRQLAPPRTVLVYVPHGAPLQAVISGLNQHLSAGDLIVDGGNSHWKESRQQHEQSARRGIEYLDVGTSGGLNGARHGACFMVGGSAAAFARVEPLLRDLAVPGAVAHVGPAGAGHFVKLIHNAVEFGMLQALGEGLDLLVRSEYPLDLAAIVENWRHGSVIRGWLVDLLAEQLREHRLSDLSAYVEDTREVRWAIEFALEQEAWIPVITQAELSLYRYRDSTPTAAKAVALMRHAFGGHPLHLADGVEARRAPVDAQPK